MFLVCGEALWDLFAAEDEAGLVFNARIGGSPFNVAVGLARLGQRAALLTGLSTDRLGARLAAALEAEGVLTDFLIRTPHPTTLSLVDLAPDGSPAYAFYGEGAADRAVLRTALPALGSEIWGVHAGSYSLVVEPVGASLLALAEREAGHRLITLDPNVRPTVEPDLDLWRARVDRFVACADVVKVSAEDLELLQPGVNPAQVAARWRALGAALVVVTHGADGAEAFGAAGGVSAPSAPVEVVDTVGAGDAFMAALIAGLAECGATTRSDVEALGSEQVESLLRLAAEAAGITCGRRGADLPRRSELGLDVPETV